jgi:transcriptional regulator GlxA family with amidase domain
MCRDHDGPALRDSGGGADIAPRAPTRAPRGQARVREIAKDAGLSQRRLIELFTAAVGLTPKRFGRVLRFHRAAALGRSAAFDWTRVAHECGYYDQAHLIRDFRELAEVTPSDLLSASVHPEERHQLAVPTPSGR